MSTASTARTILSAVVAWLAVVAVGSTVVWAVISRVGEGLTPTAGGVAATARPHDTAPTPRSAGPSGPSSSAPGRSPSAAPHPGRPTTPPTSAPSPSSSPEGVPQRRTWQGPGGLVTAECRGASVVLVATSADPGFVVDPEARGPEQVRVVFEGQGDDERGTTVLARCEGGVPAFDAAARDS